MPEPRPDVPRIVPPATSGTAGFVGRFTRGPLDVPVAIDSRQQLDAVFGPALAEGDTSVAVEQFLRNGGARARVVRVSGTAGPADPTALLGSAVERTGLHALTTADADLVAIPDAARTDPDTAARLYADAAGICQRSGAFLLVDPPDGLGDTGALRTWITRSELRSRDAALYAPWVVVEDPVTGRPRRLPPSGTVAGVLARTDVARGVWKAAAGTEATLRDVLHLDADYDDRDQELLGQEGVNLLRRFPSRGDVVWGSRTLAAREDAVWRYVPVRRTTALLQRTFDGGFGWVVGRANDEVLWAQIRSATEGSLQELWRRGAFPASRPDQAYYVRCGRGSTMTEADVAAGLVHLEVGLALVRPAEFTILRVRCTTVAPGIEAEDDPATTAVLRVDLGHVGGRYIGETEKNLGKLLRRAGDSDVVVSFGEADALFGRRTDARLHRRSTDD